MPEMKRVFTSGKMNKDLDERLVPNGEYTDALNVQVAASEDNNVGAIENVLGNQLRNRKDSSGDWAFVRDAVCIGQIKVDSTDKIYWFLTNGTVHAIAEYDQSLDLVKPVVVDKNNVLNFDDKFLITGVNVIDNLLLWTDDLNDPRKINIDTFKSGSIDFDTHTVVYTRPFTAADVAVIKKAPTVAPSLLMSSTVRTSTGGTGIGCGINKIKTTFDFTDPVSAYFLVKEVGTSVTLQYDELPNWFNGDIISLTASKLNDNNFIDEYQVRLQVNTVDATVTPYEVNATIVTISSSIQDYAYEWTSVLEEDPPMFEFKFPRFSYRWKYADGEYSTFAPWSEVAFVADSFKYNSSRSHNIGMTNNIRYLNINSLQTPSEEVVEVDILYKESNSTVVYKVDSIPVVQSGYTITSELIGNVVPSNQSLRPWDNVPIKAKSQEVIGNRVVYGNYEQNLSMKSGSNSIQPIVSASLDVNTHSSVENPLKSIKSMRTYQIGVLYGDEYGRETPVFSSNGGSVVSPKSNSEKVVKLKARVTTQAPDFASYFKYLVKETSNEYYNLALDRFYKADDGNVWLSFPSAERNKLQTGDYMILKKEHDTSVAVVEDARYRVLDISNNAPDDVVRVRTFQTAYKCTMAQSGLAVGGKNLLVNGPTQIQDPKFFEVWDSTCVVRFWNTVNGTSNVSDFYEIREGGFSGDTTTRYSIVLKDGLGSEDSWMSSLASGATINVQVYKYENVYKKEYQGKFFVKINRDPSFDEYIINPLVQDQTSYIRVNSSSIIDLTSTDDPDDGFLPPGIGEVTYGVYGTQYPSIPIQGSANFSLFWTGSTQPSGTTVGTYWFDNIKVGTFVKFDQDSTNTYYEIVNITHNGPFITGGDGAWGLIKTIVLNTAVTADTSSWTDYNFKMYAKKTDWADILDSDNVILSSSNPAIFETEPKESVDIDLYYEITDGIPMSQHGNDITIQWSNCFSFGNGCESNRIRDDFNAVTIDKGPRVSSTLEEPYSVERKGSSLIFSGIYNSTSGVNNLNQFLMAENITKDFNPVYGTIQKLHARDTDLIVMCEDKVFRVLADKDALYNADGNANLTASNRVLGQSIPYVGEFGISKNPESFASYGFRAYFTDKNRGVVLRLSRDGLTEISRHGMSDFFKRNLNQATTAIGSFDDYSNLYHLTLNGETISFNDDVNGWTSRKSFLKEGGLSLNNVYYTFKNGMLWSHDSETRCNFYGNQHITSVQFVYNDDPSRIKNFKTLSYEGSSGWVCPLILTDSQDGEVEFFKNKEGIWYNYIKGLATTWDPTTQTGSLDTREFSVQGIDIAEYVEDNSPSITIGFLNNINVSLQSKANDIVMYKSSVDGNIYVVGQCVSIDHANNKITCTLAINGSVPIDGDFIFFAKSSEVNTSGIIGYYGRVDMQVQSTEFKELFAVNSEVFISS